MATETPQLRICLIPYCNLHCVYCTPEGEGYSENLEERMTREEIKEIITESVNVGFTHFKFTGGEPLLREDTVEIIRDTKKIPGVKEVQMVTNGTLLERTAEKLKDAGLDVITISIDAAHSAVYKRIRGGKLQTVVSGLQKCKDVGLPVRINSVLMKSNFDQIQPLIDLAHEAGASLKFLDVMDLQREDDSFQFWREQFLPFNVLRDRLTELGGELIGYENAPGGIGAPLIEYRMPNGLQVVIKDSMEGTYYADYCKECQFYPCQDALISLRVTHDGNLKMCLIRNDNLLDTLTPLRNGDMSMVREHLENRFNILAGAKYKKGAWIPRSQVG